jgi:dsDNA-specific endonuclease/ATPase MutS2
VVPVPSAVRVVVTREDADVIELPIDGTLDLHAFRPSEVKDLVPGYLEECRARGILEVRIIHGKGTGALRETVRAILERMDGVVAFRLAGDGGGWGATIVELRAGTAERGGEASGPGGPGE